MKVAIAGLGTVGAAALELLRRNMDLYKSRSGEEITVTAVSARNKSKHFDIPESVQWYDNPLEMIDKADVVLELIGGEGGIALELIEKSIKLGRHVVTANKALIAKHGERLTSSASNSGVALAFEAAVAGGIPVIKTLREGLAANRINTIAGILNGTCNYILTTMEKTGRDFNEVLREAQDLGYAEAEPSFDIDGIDTAQKLSILTWLAFGASMGDGADKPTCEGIRDITLADLRFVRELGYRIKLIGMASANNGCIFQAVHPALIHENQALAQVDGSFNAIEINADPVGKIVLEGRGAGGGATASAIVADVLDIAAKRFSHSANAVNTGVSESGQGVISKQMAYYMRMNVLDMPGVVADISGIMRDNNISIESLQQRGREAGQPVNIFMTVHKTESKAITDAVAAITRLKAVLAPPLAIRIYCSRL